MGSQESAAGSGLPKTVCSFEGIGKRKKPPAVWVKVMPSWPLARLLPLNWSPHGAVVCSLFEFSPVCFGRIYPTICSGVVQRSLPITLPFSSVNHMAPSPLESIAQRERHLRLPIHTRRLLLEWWVGCDHRVPTCSPLISRVEGGHYTLLHHHPPKY